MNDLLLICNKLISKISKKLKEKDVKLLEQLLLHDINWQKVSFENKIMLLKRLRPRDDQSPIRNVVHYREEEVMLQNMFGELNMLSLEQKIQLYLEPSYIYSYDFDQSILESKEITVDMLVSCGQLEFAGRKLHKIPITERNNLLLKYADNGSVVLGYEKECYRNDSEPKDGGYQRGPRC